MRAARFVSVVAALAVALGAAPTAGKGSRNTYEPPYRRGPSGGDEFNHVESDPASGSVRVLRVFPGIPPVVGCAPEPSAGWAMLRAKHDVTAPVDKVTVRFDAQLEGYAWLTAGLRDERGRWIGVEKLQGPHLGEGKLVVRPHSEVQLGSTMTIEFGVQLGDACPQVGGAAAVFESIVVR